MFSFAINMVSVCTILIAFANVCNAARILGVVPTPSYSHQVVFQPIWKELSLRGHQVTTITTDPLNDPALANLTEIDLHFLYGNNPDKLQEFIDSNIFGAALFVIKAYETIGDIVLSHPDVQNLIKDVNRKFDVVMIEHSVLAMRMFAERFNAPLIMLSPVDALTDLQTDMGNPTHPVLYPNILVSTTDNPSLLDRIVFVAYKLFTESLKTFVVIPRQQVLVNKYFGTQYTALQNIDISLALVNSDTTFYTGKPLIPTIVQIGGGTHRTPKKPLPIELKNTLDAAKHGFIYFSLGSNVKSKDLSKETRDVILETFSEIPYTVLWKFESDELPNKPKNVITSKWFPQQDVFKHPNIKLFITQGGLQSMEEAIYDHIPMLALPFAGDQNFNVNRMIHRGFGLSLNYRTLRKDEFKTSILEIINNSKYRNTVKEFAELAMDQPMTGLEKAIWWTEYVIRHKGTRHMRSPLLDIPFYQYYLLDVIAILTTTLIVIVGIIFLVFKFLFRIVQTVTFRKVKTQ
ncbi:hypothetical protein FQR65_LT08690 [Abscondita terminalis]|nr:hypothetical protein FQR65_LT08690 [Abscondita terminalis]